MDSNDTLLNYLVILGKLFLFKGGNIEHINFNFFVNLVGYKYKIEREGAKLTGNWEQFLKKWEVYINATTN